MNRFTKLAIILSIVISGTIIQVQAQEGGFGVRVGLDFNIPGDVELQDGRGLDLFDTGVGFDVTGVYNIPLGYDFYFEPGVSLYYNVLSTDISLIKDDLLPPGTSKAGMSARMFGLRLPLILGYSFPLDIVRMHIFAGPVLQIGLAARNYIHFKYGDINYSGGESAYGDDANPSFDRFDCAIRLGAGIEYNNMVFQLYGNIGTCDQLNTVGAHGQTGKSSAKMRTSQLVLAVGYNF